MQQQLMQQTNILVRHGKSMLFEAKLSYSHAARQGLPCYNVISHPKLNSVNLNGFKHCATAI